MLLNPLSPLDEFNQQLLLQVHPGNWVNPQPSGRYNLVVIGAGTAGLVTAAGAAGLGAKVALIERELMGGDCLNVGCVPSKALLRASRCVAEMRRGPEFGVNLATPPQVDFATLMARMRRLRAGLSIHDSAARFTSLGVDVYLGDGRFASPDTIQVGDRTLNFRRAVIATGARATRPSIPGLEDVGYLTNETVFNLTELPRRLAVIGAGPIGCELAQGFARLGSQVWLIDKYEQILPKEDPEAARIVAAAFREDGVRLVSLAAVENVFRNGPDRVLQCRVADHAEEIRVDAILVGVGRTPNVEGLNLEAVGVAYDLRKGIQVDDALRTTNPRIYAAGDICSQHKFTHAADFQARIVIQNALFYGRGRASALTIPRCTYTSPEIAAVGLNEHSARERGIAINTFMQPLEKVDRAILDGEQEGFVKVHVRQGSDQILGATIVAAHAGDLISEISVAMAGKVGLRRLASVIHPYPTQADAIRKLGDAYNRTRLTPFVKKLFERWLKWTR